MRKVLLLRIYENEIESLQEKWNSFSLLWKSMRKETNFRDLHGVIHLVSTQEVHEKLTFLPYDTHTYMCVSGGKDSSFFGKFCIRSK